MNQSCFFYRRDGLLRRINCADILFLEASDNYTRIHTEKGVHTVRATFKSVLEKLEEKGIVQIHRSHAILVDRLDTITGEQVILAGEKEVEVPFNRKYLPQLAKHLEIIGPPLDLEDEAES
ncbi:LytTR family DNA-binding domain-containing protein [Flavihumibacter petaseus]|uniref:Putative LytTR family DNA-binding protein n=1 Tax=Flavihumibacter petaseus NBRC 106054 TaxID=1220578 RepID=A0A0E9N1M6_9BACT|nr:LytTR family DNA-binding domain-containing protein [Flavihumibacter petaseus]GAO43917.1 putative LytTR family DNA-binding protein [Flavihumibacter petaseus NBRC 106054]